MMLPRPMKRQRGGSACVECAVCLLFLVPLLLGLWEVGRLVEVEQFLNNAVREGGRQASTGMKNAAGVWTFSTLLDGENDYKELVPIGPLSSQRSQLAAALTTIRPKPNGDTGLYDTILAGYKALQAGWDPGRVNSLVIMTDGQNDDKHGVTLDQLIGALKQIVDPKRPIQVIAIGIGTGVSRDELQKITSATGGGVFITADPSQIGDIFLQAIALRPSH